MKLMLSLILGLSTAFAFAPRQTVFSRGSELFMAPRFDKKEQKWYPTKPEDGPEAGYPLSRTLLLHGPKPFFSRIFSPDDYEQAVLKFMAGDKCSRDEAQGNMDAYIRNPQDWQFDRMEMEKRGFKRDYVTLNTQNLILTLVWAGIVVAFGGRAAYAITTSVDFWAFGPFKGSV